MVNGSCDEFLVFDSGKELYVVCLMFAAMIGDTGRYFVFLLVQQVFGVSSNLDWGSDNNFRTLVNVNGYHRLEK